MRCPEMVTKALEVQKDYRSTKDSEGVVFLSSLSLLGEGASLSVKSMPGKLGDELVFDVSVEGRLLKGTLGFIGGIIGGIASLPSMVLQKAQKEPSVS